MKFSVYVVLFESVHAVDDDDVAMMMMIYGMSLLMLVVAGCGALRVAVVLSLGDYILLLWVVSLPFLAVTVEAVGAEAAVAVAAFLLFYAVKSAEFAAYRLLLQAFSVLKYGTKSCGSAVTAS